MIRFRRLQVKDNRGHWYTDAYAVEDSRKQVSLHYPLAWEHLGSEYNAQIRQRNIPLEQLEFVLASPRLRWMEIESVAIDFVRAVDQLDRECGFGMQTKKHKTHIAA